MRFLSRIFCNFKWLDNCNAFYWLNQVYWSERIALKQEWYWNDLEALMHKRDYHYILVVKWQLAAIAGSVLYTGVENLVPV